MFKGIFEKFAGLATGVSHEFLKDEASELLRGGAQHGSNIEEWVAKNSPLLQVGFFGRMSGKYKSIFDTTMSTYVDDELIAVDNEEKGIPPEDAQEAKNEVMNFLHNLENWQSELYMFHVATQNNQKDRLHAIDAMFDANNDAERQIVIDEMVGSKPFMTVLGEHLKKFWDEEMTPENREKLYNRVIATYGSMENYISNLIRNISAPDWQRRYEQIKAQVQPVAEEVERASVRFNEQTKDFTPVLFSNFLTGKKEKTQRPGVRLGRC